MASRKHTNCRTDTTKAIAPKDLRIGGSHSDMLFKHPLLIGGPLIIFKINTYQNLSIYKGISFIFKN
jgi:hypothetical protein